MRISQLMSFFLKPHTKGHLSFADPWCRETSIPVSHNVELKRYQ